MISMNPLPISSPSRLVSLPSLKLTFTPLKLDGSEDDHFPFGAIGAYVQVLLLLVSRSVVVS